MPTRSPTGRDVSTLDTGGDATGRRGSTDCASAASQEPIEAQRRAATQTPAQRRRRPAARRVYRAHAQAVGDKAPAFTLSDQDGNTVKLSGFKGRKVLVYFYPKADTPGCTTQACGLRDILGEVGDTAIVGISPDKPAAQKKFDTKYSLGFPLLSDTDHAVAEAFGVWKEKSMYGRKYMGIERSAFLIDEKGKVAQAWYKISPKDTPGQAARRPRPVGRRHGRQSCPRRPDVLPHRPPFLFVDEVTALEPGAVGPRAPGT